MKSDSNTSSSSLVFTVKDGLSSSEVFEVPEDAGDRMGGD
jgi:hypothetical protein